MQADLTVCLRECLRENNWKNYWVWRAQDQWYHGTIFQIIKMLTFKKWGYGNRTAVISSLKLPFNNVVMLYISRKIGVHLILFVCYLAYSYQQNHHFPRAAFLDNLITFLVWVRFYLFFTLLSKNHVASLCCNLMLICVFIYLIISPF